MKRIAVDVGGTFTDFAMQDGASEGVVIAKQLTTPEDPSVGVMHGIQRLIKEGRIELREVSQIVHGTTYTSNLIIERKGVNTYLLTTKGFRDVLEIARIKRYDLYDLFIDKPVPLVSRNAIFEISERMNYDGSIRVPLDEEEARRVIRKLAALGAESVGICLLHSYVNPLHEQRMKKIIEEEAPHLYVSLASEISPKYKEYERTSTTVTNAYLMKGVARYLHHLKEEFEKGGFQRDIFIMQSNGGIATSSTMEKFPVHMVESGPAAGAQLSAFIGKTLGAADLISFDMGGTTAKICPIVKGQPQITDEFEIEKIRLRTGSGLPINIPAIDMIEIGAGGGSVARVKMGMIAVGPDSAGAFPGPICYGRGGDEPTVTDANLVLGYLNPDFFAGGEMRLDTERAARGISEKIAQPLGYSLEQAAAGIHQIVTTNMASALRVMTIERGYDPREFLLMAFGGAGPMHGCPLARAVGIRKVVIPIFAGVASALGMLITDPKFDISRTFMSRLDSEILTRLREIYGEMELQGRASLESCGVPGTFHFARSCDMRYLGQGHEINIRVLESDLNEAGMEQLKARFGEAYKRSYGYVDEDAALEVVTLKLVATCRTEKFDLNLRGVKSTGENPQKGVRKIYIPGEKEFVPCPVYDREKLYPGFEGRGPAIVEEKTSSTVILPDDRLAVDEFGNLVITIKEQG